MWCDALAPSGKSIFLLRNPLAVFTSILEAWIQHTRFGHQYAIRYDFMHELLTAAIARPAPNTGVLQYESLVQSPTSAVANVCQQLQLTFHPEIVEYGDNNDDRWNFGDQGTVYSEQQPIPGRAER